MEELGIQMAASPRGLVVDTAAAIQQWQCTNSPEALPHKEDSLGRLYTECARFYRLMLRHASSEAEFINLSRSGKLLQLSGPLGSRIWYCRWRTRCAPGTISRAASYDTWVASQYQQDISGKYVASCLALYLGFDTLLVLFLVITLSLSLVRRA